MCEDQPPEPSVPCAPSQPRGLPGTPPPPAGAPAPSSCSAQSPRCREALLGGGSGEEPRCLRFAASGTERLFEFQATICIQMKVI